MSIFGKTNIVSRTIVTSWFTLHQNTNIKRFSRPVLPLVCDSSSARAIQVVLDVYIHIENEVGQTLWTKACRMTNPHCWLLTKLKIHSCFRWRDVQTRSVPSFNPLSESPVQGSNKLPAAGQSSLDGISTGDGRVLDEDTRQTDSADDSIDQPRT